MIIAATVLAPEIAPMRFLRFRKSQGVIAKSELRKERAAVKQSDEVIGRGSELVTTPRGYAIANYTIKKGDRRSIIEVNPMPNFNQMIMKSRRASSVRELSDGKDYMEADLDRRPSARRRKDMLASNQEWPGIQALDDELSDSDFEDDDSDESHEMLVSGRPSRIKFPGSRGDSELRPPQWSEYTSDEDDPDNELDGQARIAERNLRNTLGGDRLARRSMRRDRGVADAYTAGKSLSYRPRRALSFELIKSRLQDAMADGNLDPTLLLNFASSEPRCGIDLAAQMRALATIPPQVRRRYRLPEDLGPWEIQGEIRRELSAA